MKERERYYSFFCPGHHTFLPIRHRNSYPYLCLSVPIMYPHCELWLIINMDADRRSIWIDIDIGLTSIEGWRLVINFGRSKLRGHWSPIGRWWIGVCVLEELDGPAVSAPGVQSRKLSNVDQSLDAWPKIYYLEFLRASEGTLSCYSWLRLQSLALTNLHWARVVGYGPFSLCVIHKTCAPAVRISRLMIWCVGR
jgi:hypothetical protein